MNTAQSAKIARRIDDLLAQVGKHYRELRRLDRRVEPGALREALSSANLPGGYSKREREAQSLTAQLQEETQHVQTQ